MFKCSLTAAKRLLYKAVNVVFGEIGGRSSKNLQLIPSLQLIRSLPYFWIRSMSFAFVRL